MKPRVIKDFEKLPPSIQEQIKLGHPWGFQDHLISYTNKEGQNVSVLPFETDETYYMVRMTKSKAEDLVSNDEDYDEDGTLKEDIKGDYELKYGDLEYMEAYLTGDENEDENENEDDQEEA